MITLGNWGDLHSRRVAFTLTLKVQGARFNCEKANRSVLRAPIRNALACEGLRARLETVAAIGLAADRSSWMTVSCTQASGGRERMGGSKSSRAIALLARAPRNV